MTTNKHLELTGQSLTIGHLIEATQNTILSISQQAQEKIKKSETLTKKIIQSKQPVYGINTGFGIFSKTQISAEKLQKCQENLIRSHATGVGNPLTIQQTKAMMICQLNKLANGYSGIRLKTVNTYLELFNNNIIPIIPEKGTVGASGDLPQLAYIALTLIGEGMVYHPITHTPTPTLTVLNKYNITPVTLDPKEGLALINGTEFQTALGSIALNLAKTNFNNLLLTMTLHFIALRGYRKALLPIISKIRPHEGQTIVAKIIYNLTPDTCSKGNPDIQGPYSLRCTPQGLGPCYDYLKFIQKTLEIELNSVTDNPIIDPETQTAISAGNFHGQYPASACDTLSLASTLMGNFCEATTKRCYNPAKNWGLPFYLVEESGLNSGFMMWETTMAALVAENRAKSSPASIHNISTGADKEDHVPMGGYAARNALEISKNMQNIGAISLLTAVHACRFRLKTDNLELTEPIKSLYTNLSTLTPLLTNDRQTDSDLQNIKDYMNQNITFDCFTNTPLTTTQPTPKKPSKQNVLQLPYTNHNHHLTRPNETRFIQLKNIQPKTGTKKDLIALIKQKKPIPRCILSTTQWDLGIRANLGKTASPLHNPKTIYDMLAKTQVNQHTKTTLNSLIICGDLTPPYDPKNYNTLDPLIPSHKAQLKRGVKDTHKHLESWSKTIFSNKATLFHFGGGHDLLLPLITGYHSATKTKPILLYLDHHADTRPIEDGPHSGTWCSQIQEQNIIKKTILIGLHPYKNNNNTIKNCKKYNIDYTDYTYTHIQEKGFQNCVTPLLKKLKTDHPNTPVVLSICADSIQSIPSSAQTHATGYSTQDTYWLIQSLAKSHPIPLLNIAEINLNLSHSPTQTQTSIEWLTQCLGSLS